MKLLFPISAVPLSHSKAIKPEKQQSRKNKKNNGWCDSWRTKVWQIRQGNHEPQQFCLYQTERCCFGPSSWSTWPTRAVRTLWRGPDSFRAVLIQSRIGNTDSLLHLAVFIASRLPPPCSILHRTQIQRRGDGGKVDMQSWLSKHGLRRQTRLTAPGHF